MSFYRLPIFDLDKIIFKCLSKYCQYEYYMFIDPAQNEKELHAPYFMMHRCLFAPGPESRLSFIDDHQKQSFTGGTNYTGEWLEEMILKK